ncbi:alpha/beta hydrolase [Cytobacillus purgationiresistens]|uniref:Acetyl esterase/lipase n=1 Tax=Cytobacillus purgationiresistens TaxID=863449 RepID=A0ABU0ABH3_9BACI|nr:alpha/beta hydrolase [Cytobacillus purgationiresistens]MDQ0268599.1 acetyl esterase/lipase [Cytobacillus purgationiresistens]
MDFMSRVAEDLKEMVKIFPAFNLPEGLEAARQAPSVPIEPSPHVSTSVQMITGGDSQPMKVKIYEPAGRGRISLPALLFIHGGGYVVGDPDGNDGICEIFSEEAKCVVVSVDYRLAPENPYPAPLEDCYAALTWMAQSADDLNIDVSRLAVAGQSAGGGLTAALSLLARDRSGPEIIFQMPLYPMIDDRNTTPSSYEITDERAIWNRGNNLAAWRMYLGEHANGDISPYAAPARAKNYSGLPPTYTCVGQLDPFRDETLDYVTRLMQAGVPVEFHLYPGAYHAFEILNPTSEIGVQAVNGYVQALAKALNPQNEKVLSK